MGDLFTADWHIKLAMAGKVYTLNLGSCTGSSVATVLTGNAAVDNDQPEFVVSINSGWLIPMELDICADVDFDAYNDIVECLLVGDRTQATTALGTANAPSNNLDGGDTFEGYAADTFTASITNPSGTEVLHWAKYRLTQVGTETAGSVPPYLKIYRRFTIPRFFAGPAQIVGFLTGTDTPEYSGSFTFAHLPTSWVTVT